MTECCKYEIPMTANNLKQDFYGDYMGIVNNKLTVQQLR